MKGRIAALLIIAVMLLPVAGLMYASDESEAALYDITFKGIVEYNGAKIVGADVHLVWIEKTDNTDPELDPFIEKFTGIGETDGDGSFSIIINHHYVTTAENTLILTYMTDSNVRVSKEISIEGFKSGNVVDLLTVNEFVKNFNSTPGILVSGTVKYEGNTLEGARISLFKKGTETRVAFDNTDDKGTFELICEPGTYYIIVERGGFFDSVPKEYTFGASSSIVLDDIYLVVSPDTTYWGLDLPHLFSLIGLFIALILLISVVAYVLWIRKHPGKIRIVDDDPDNE